MITKRQFLFASAGGVVGFGLASSRASAQSRSPTPQQVYFDPGNPVLGNPKGDVTIAEFFDFQCPYCKHDFPTVQDVVRKDGNVRLVMRNWPIFGPPSIYAAHLALGGSKIGRYDEVLGSLMATKARLSRADVDRVIEKAGLDVDRLKKAYSEHKDSIDRALQRTNALAESFSMPGTPGYVIGRAVYRGSLDRDRLEAAIDRARERASEKPHQD